MKTVEQVKKQIAGIDWFIDSHKKQLDFYLNEEFNIDKAVEYSNKIKSLQVEKCLLEWVLSDS